MHATDRCCLPILPQRRTDTTKKRRLRQRETDFGLDDDDDGLKLDADEVLQQRDRERGAKRRKFDPEEAEAEAEREREAARQRDLEERDAFAERLRKADEEATRKIVEDSGSKRLREEAEFRAGVDAATERDLVDAQREKARQVYLEKREADRITLLEEEIADEEFMFEGIEMTERERRALDKKKQLLEYVKAKQAIDDTYDGYQMPEQYEDEKGRLDREKQQKAMFGRYVDDGDEEERAPNHEQMVWEEEQIAKATIGAGGDPDDRPDDGFDLVLEGEDDIEFVAEQQLEAMGAQIMAQENAPDPEELKRMTIAQACD